MSKRKTVMVYPYNLQAHQIACPANARVAAQMVREKMPEGNAKKLVLGFLIQVQEQSDVIQAGLEALEKDMEVGKTKYVTVIDYGK